MFAPLANALEVRLDFAFKLQSITPRTGGEGILDNIAAQLGSTMVSIELLVAAASHPSRMVHCTLYIVRIVSRCLS